MRHSTRPLALALSLLLAVGCATLLPAANVREGARVQLRFPEPPLEGATYRWVQTSGPAVEIETPDQAEAAFVTPEGTGNYRMIFARLSERDGVTETREFGVYVISENDPPIVDAGEDVRTAEGEVVTLFGTGSDPEDEELTFTWEQLSGPPIQLASALDSKLVFEAPGVEGPTDLVFALHASDGANDPVTDEVRVEVRAINGAPTLSAIEDRVAAPGDTLELEVQGSDPEGEELTYTWELRSSGPDIRIEQDGGPRARLRTRRAPAGVASYTLSVSVTASDGTQTSKPEAFVVSVVAREGVPLAEAGPDLVVTEGQRIRLQGRGTHPTGGDLEYSWRQESGTLPIELIDANTASPAFLAPTLPEGHKTLEAVFELTVSDGSLRGRDLVRVSVESAFKPRPKRVALAPGEVDPLFRLDAPFLSRWLRPQEAPTGESRGFHPRVAENALLARFNDSEGRISCDLPPGHWRFEGELDFTPTPRESGADPNPDRASYVRFETAEGEAIGFGLFETAEGLGVGLRLLERDEESGLWSALPETTVSVETWRPGDPLHFRCTWEGLSLSVRWSVSHTTLEQVPLRTLELSRAPELMSFVVRDGDGRAADWRLSGLE